MRGALNDAFPGQDWARQLSNYFAVGRDGHLDLFFLGKLQLQCGPERSQQKSWRGSLARVAKFSGSTGPA